MAAGGNDVLNSVDQRLADMSGIIDQRAGTLVGALNDKVKEIDQTLGARASRLIGVLGEKAEELSRKAEDIDRTLGGRATDIANSFDTRINRFETLLVGRAEAVTRDIESRGKATAERLTVSIANLENVANSAMQSLTSGVSQAHHTLTSLAANVTETVRQTASEVENTLASASSEAERTLSSVSSEAERTVTTLSSEVAKAVAQSAADARQTLSAVSINMTNMVKLSTSEAERAVTLLSSEVANSIGQSASEAERKLTTASAEIANAVTQKASEAERNLISLSAEIGKAIEHSATEADRVLTAVSSGFGKAIELSASEAERSLVVVSTEVADALKQNAGEAERTLSSISNELARTIDQSASEAERALSAASSEIARVIGHGTSEAERALTQASTGITEALKHNAAETERSLTALSSGVSGSLKQNAADVERTLLGVSSQVARNFVSKAEEIVVAVGNGSANLTRVLDEHGGELINAIGTKTTELASEISRITEQAAKTIETKNSALAYELASRAQEIVEQITDKGERSAEAITSRMLTLQEAAAAAIEQSKQTASTAVSEMMETHGMLRTDATALFERLRDANGLLQDVLGGAQNNLGSIEQILSVRVTEFVATMNNLLERTGATTTSLDEHIGSFYGVTQQVLGNLGDLAQQFDAHGRSLSEAVAQLDNSSKRTESSVTDQRAALETLVATLDNRTGDLDQRLKRFSTLLEESFVAAEARARDIARTIAEGMNTSTHAITEQYEQVRNATDEERKRTMESLHSIYQQAIGDSEVMFQSATERFTEIVQSMKQMASEMQHELDNTRQELRRGILELPQETAETTAQMRRVIVDQIDALAELNRIVARHGREFEAAEPVREPVRRVQEAISTGTGGPRRVDAPPQRPVVRAESHPTAPPIVPPQPQRRCRARAIQLAQAGNGGQANWLSDLLNRASQPEPPQPRGSDGRVVRQEERQVRQEERPTRHTIESLELTLGRHRPHDRPRRRRRTLGALQSRRTQRVHAPPLHHAGPEDVRGDSPALPRRPRVQADRRPLYRGVRALARRGLARRPRPSGGAYLSHVGNRQGLHHAGPRLWSYRIDRGLIAANITPAFARESRRIHSRPGSS